MSKHATTIEEQRSLVDQDTDNNISRTDDSSARESRCCLRDHDLDRLLLRDLDREELGDRLRLRLLLLLRLRLRFLVLPLEPLRDRDLPLPLRLPRDPDREGERRRPGGPAKRPRPPLPNPPLPRQLGGPLRGGDLERDLEARRLTGERLFLPLERDLDLDLARAFRSFSTFFTSTLSWLPSMYPSCIDLRAVSASSFFSKLMSACPSGNLIALSRATSTLSTLP